MIQQILFHPARRLDLAQLVAIQKPMHAPSHLARYVLDAKTLVQLMANTDAGVFVASHAGTVVGLCVHKGGMLPEIICLYVKQKYRNKQVGTRLLQAASTSMAVSGYQQFGIRVFLEAAAVPFMQYLGRLGAVATSEEDHVLFRIETEFPLVKPRNQVVDNT